MDQSSTNNAASTSSYTSAYIGNLRSDISVEELREKLQSLFETVGISILVSDIEIHRKSWKKPAYALVVLRDKSTFDFAVEKLNGTKKYEIVFTGKELVISSAYKQNLHLSQPHSSTKTVVKSVRKNSKRSKHKTANDHKDRHVGSLGVAMETSTISHGDQHTNDSLLNDGQIFPIAQSMSSLMKNDPNFSGMKGFVPQGKFFYVGQKLGTEDRITEYKQGRGNYLDGRFKVDVGKYVCAFLNSEGGTLLIGVKDDCTVCGTEISTSRKEDQLRLQTDEIMKGFNPKVFPNLYSIKFIPVHPPSLMIKSTDTKIQSGNYDSSQLGDGNPTQLPDVSSNKALKCDGGSTGDGNLVNHKPPFSLSSPPVPRKLPPLNVTSEEENASGLSNKNVDSLSTSNLTAVTTSGQDNPVVATTVSEKALKVIEISVQSPPRTSGGQRTLYQNQKREVYIRLDGSIQGPLQASEIVEWGQCNMAESLHMEHDYLKQQVQRKQEEITMNLKLVDDLVKQKQFLEDQYKEKENSLISEIDKLQTREKEIEGELEQVRKAKSKVCTIS